MSPRSVVPPFRPGTKVFFDAGAIGAERSGLRPRRRDLVLVEGRGVLGTRTSDGNLVGTFCRGMIRDRSGIGLFQGWDNKVGWMAYPARGPAVAKTGCWFSLIPGEVANGPRLDNMVLSQGLRGEMRIEWALDCRSPMQAQCHALRAPQPLD